MALRLPTAVPVTKGFQITYVGDPNVCTYWEVVGVSGGSEVSPVGALKYTIVDTDNDGYAINHYIPSGDSADVGKVEKVKVSVGA